MASHRVIRGGGCNYDDDSCQSASRCIRAPGCRINGSLGFRLAMKRRVE